MATSAPELTARARQIVAAGRELLEEGGPDALSMRRVADRLGIRAPSIYKHLPDKEALEVALIADGLREFAEACEAATAGATDPLAALGGAYRAFARAHPHLYRSSTAAPFRGIGSPRASRPGPGRPSSRPSAATPTAPARPGPSRTGW